MSGALCSICLLPVATFKCGLCKTDICKKCEEFLEIDYFSFREVVAPDLVHGHYCPSCYEEKIAAEKSKYDEHIEKARAVYIFFDSEPHPRTLIKKANQNISIMSRDRDEAFLRMGFTAFEKGYNSVIEASVERTKSRHMWHASGTPANIDTVRQDRFQY